MNLIVQNLVKMSWYNIFRKFGFKQFWEDILYRLDWRKPEKEHLRPFLAVQVHRTRQLMKDNKLPQYSGTNDQKVIKYLKWVKGKITYEVDKKRFGVAEKWQTVDETLGFMKGDCEDGAILLMACCIASGVNPAQLVLVAGKVTGGGHCWVEYQSDEFYPEWYTLDWCYWPSVKEFKWRIPKSENYIKDWFRISVL